MNKEIKEMLDNMKEISSFDYTTDWFELNYEDTKILYDYITNLQEKLNRIDKLINTDYGWESYYYKYNNRYLKSEIKEDINNILEGSDKE